MTLAIRPALPADLRFVVASWVSSTKDAYTSGLIQWDDYHRVMFAQLGKALERPDVQTLIMHETTAPPAADIYGWIAFDPTPQVEPLEAGGHRTWRAMVFYCYVKEAYRRAGIARRLFAATGIDPASPFAYACTNHVVSDLELKIPAAKWRPLLARRKKISPHQPIVTSRRA